MVVPAMAELWGELLGIENVGIYDEFEELGGHSLIAVQMSARIADAFALELPPVMFFECPTIAALSERFF